MEIRVRLTVSNPDHPAGEEAISANLVEVMRTIHSPAVPEHGTILRFEEVVPVADAVRPSDSLRALAPLRVSEVCLTTDRAAQVTEVEVEVIHICSTSEAVRAAGERYSAKYGFTQDFP